MPAQQDLVHIIPVQATGVHTGALVGQFDGLICETHLQPGGQVFFLFKIRKKLMEMGIGSE